MTLASCAPARWNCPYPNWNSNWCRASRAPSSPLPEAGNSATRWCWTRSKSERGDALAQLAHKLAEVDAAAGDDHQARRAEAIARFWAPRGAAAIKLREDMSPPQAMGAIAAECLDQIARNAAVLAEVDTEGVYRAGNSEHVHQLRVGVRRLRSAWKLFDGWIAPVPDAMLQQARAPSAPTATRTC